jgi:sulfate permease, SulP family
MLPLLVTLRRYDAGTFRSDLIAGLTVAVMLVPQAMAYAVLAGLPPVAGLYASVVPLAVYAILGTSGSLAVGPVAIVSLLTATALAPLANGDTGRYAALAATLAAMVGALQLLMGAVRAGKLVTFLSHGVISGFTSAAAIVIAVSQIPSLLGLNVEKREDFVGQLSAMAAAVGTVTAPTAAIGLGGLLALVLLRRSRRRLPGPLLVVVGATALTWALGLRESGVPVLGEVPRGLAAPTLPAFDSITALLPAAVTIAIIGYAEGIGIAKAIASRSRQTVGANQELVAVGAANVAAGLFSAFPVAGGLSRTAVNHEAGSKTTVASLVTAAMVALTVTFLTPLFTQLPRAVLGAVVVAAVLRLVDMEGARHLFSYRRVDGAVWMVTFLVTMLISVELGLAAGVAASLLVFVGRASRPHIAELGQVPGTGAWRNRLRYEVELDPRVVVVRVDGPLFYASAQAVRDHIDQLVSERTDLIGVVLDASAVTDLDSDGVHMLQRLFEDMSAAGLRLALATVRGPVRDLISRSAADLTTCICPDIPSAVAYVEGEPTERAYL